MVIDRDKHNKYVAIGFQPVQQVTGGTTQQSNTGNTSSTTSGSASTSTIVINGGGGMTNAQEEKLSGIEAGAQVNQNAYSNITILNGTVEAGTITAQAETDTARISTITPIVCSLVDGVIQLTFDDTNYATKQYVIDSIDDLIGAAPGALDTLEELAQALGDDPNFATTVTNMIANVSNRVDTIEDTYAKLTDITVANITDLNSNWDSLLLNPPTDQVTRWPSWGEVTDKPTWIGDTKPTYTAEEIGALTQAAADDLYVSITGDTMTGTLTAPTICVRGTSTSTPAPGQTFKLLQLQYGNLSVGDISIDNATIYLNNNIAAGGEIRLTTVSENTLYYNNAHVLTSENYGQYIDIDAGGITQDFADSRYVNVTGDTMTGSLRVQEGGMKMTALITDGSFKIIAATTPWARSLDCYSSDGNTLIGRIAGAFGGANSVDHYYFYGGTDFQNPYMIITPTGNVGIGTTSPTAKLSVNGDITIPVTKSIVDGSVPYAGSTLAISGMDQLSNYKSFIGGIYINPNWYFGISVRHRNGYSDGNQYGLWIYTSLTAAGSLAYRKQQGTWTTERVLLDSVNYASTLNGQYVNVSGDTMTGNLTAPSVYTSNWFRSTGATGWYSETYGGGIYMTDSQYVRTFNGKAFHSTNTQYYAINSAGGFYSGWNNDYTLTEANLLNYTYATFNKPQMTVSGNNTCQPILVWSNIVNGYGYITRYSISSIRRYGWGEMAFCVGDNDAGTSVGAYVGITGAGDIFTDCTLIVSAKSSKANYNQGIRINRPTLANSATLTIGYVGDRGSTGTSANTWVIGTPANSNGLLFCNNGSATTSGLFLAGTGNSDMKWNNNVVINAANIGSYNAGSATRLQTARTITLTGAVTGSTTFNGAANVTINTKISGSYTPYLISGNNSVLNPTLYNSTMFILQNGTSNSTRTVNLPSLGMMQTYVGSTSSWFAVLLTIVTCNTNYGTWAITKPATASGATASNYYPKYFYNMSGGNVSQLGLSGPGKRMQILLYYHGSTDYTAQQIS